ncbi:MAG: ATP-binding cassette domain-containing protein [bacterium]|nr:ATP-binding cassette domain-containing protein [bacterium]
MSVGAAVNLRSVHVNFGPKKVLRNVNITVAPGESIAVLGPSGAGKTTLLRLLNRAVIPTSGSIEVAGMNLDRLHGKSLRELRSGIGFVYQDLRLVGNLRVSQNVLSGSLGKRNFFQSLLMFMKPATDDLLNVHRLLERVGIEKEMYQRVDRLSGGQQQRVALARALFQKPGLLLADEPVSSVDPARAADLLKLITEISQSQGLTLCASLHDANLAQKFFPRVVGLRDGRILFDKPTEEVTSSDIKKLYFLADSDGI